MLLLLLSLLLHQLPDSQLEPGPSRLRLLDDRPTPPRALPDETPQPRPAVQAWRLPTPPLQCTEHLVPLPMWTS